MALIDPMFAGILALVFGLLLVTILGRRGPGPAAGLIFFWVLLFLLIWAGAGWIAPVGPVAWGVPWLTLVLLGVVFTLLLAAVLPPKPPPGPEAGAPGAVESSGSVVAAGLAISIFFWVLLGLLVVLIAVSISTAPPA